MMRYMRSQPQNRDLMSVCTIVLENMEFRACHGCYDLEKVVGSRFVVTLRIEAEIGDAAERDDLCGTINYAEVYRAVQAQMAQPSNLLENVARRIIDAVYAGFSGVQRVGVTVSKLAPALGNGKIDRVSVSLEK